MKDNGSDERLEIARLIGWQIMGVEYATHIELDQWEKCVTWARNDKRPNRQPFVPKRVCVPYEQYRKICTKEK